MGEPAKKLDVAQPEPLGKGEFEMEGLMFGVLGAWGERALIVGKRYDFGQFLTGVSGVVERLIALPSGAIRAYVRSSDGSGVRKFLFFPSGTFGPEAE